MVNEDYTWDIQQAQRKSDGGIYYKAYIIGNNGDSTFDIKDILKQNGFKYDSVNKGWYTILSNNEESRKQQIEKFIKPLISNITAMGKIISNLDELIKCIDNGNIAPTQNKEESQNFDANKLKSEIESFKIDLIKSFSDGTFREKMGPIIKYRRAQGASFSFSNAILIMLQKPNAQMVKSTSNWFKANRTIKPNATPIALYVPIGQRTYTEEEAAAKKEEFLQRMSKKYGKPMTYKELSVGEREKLDKILKATTASGFKLVPSFYDLSDTEQIAGKDDLIGSLDGIDNVEWFDNTTPEDEKSIQLYNSIISVIQHSGIKLDYVTDLGGARGVSKSGAINVLKDVPKSIGTVSTLIHEFAHELLHQTYLSTKNQDFKDFFVGTTEGKQMVEQQAEITAWIVMRHFGYDMKQAINYVACWGGDERLAVGVLDSVAKVASYIIKEMSQAMGLINEAFGSSFNLTGLDVAELLGPEAVEAYKKSNLRKIQESFFGLLNRMDKK